MNIFILRYKQEISHKFFFPNFHHFSKKVLELFQTKSKPLKPHLSKVNNDSALLTSIIMPFHPHKSIFRMIEHWGNNNNNNHNINNKIKKLTYFCYVYHMVNMKYIIINVVAGGPDVIKWRHTAAYFIYFLYYDSTFKINKNNYKKKQRNGKQNNDCKPDRVCSHPTYLFLFLFILYII